MIISIVPLIIYLLLMACFNSRAHSVFLSGIQDEALLLFALIGFVFVGPVIFLVPINALMFWGIGIWPVLFLFYFLVAFMLTTRQDGRAVFYNADSGTVLEVLEKVSNWEGFETSENRTVVKMSENIYLLLQESKFFRSVSLSVTGSLTAGQLDQWHQILFDLKKESLQMKVKNKLPAIICLLGVFFLVIFVFLNNVLNHNV